MYVDLYIPVPRTCLFLVPLIKVVNATLII